MKLAYHYHRYQNDTVQDVGSFPTLLSSVSDPYSINPDPDKAKNLNPDPDPEDLESESKLFLNAIWQKKIKLLHNYKIFSSKEVN